MDSERMASQPLTPDQYCQAFFLLSAAVILSMGIVPDGVRKRLMDYGPRRGGMPGGGRGGGALYAVLERVTTGGIAQVPHRWFTHFYILTVSWSVFWAWQYLRRGAVMGFLVEWQSSSASAAASSSSAAAAGQGMDLGQVFVSWSLMALQGSRRLYESYFVTKPGSTPMLFLHWALGLMYYTSMGISMWIEGSDAILKSWQSPHQLQLQVQDQILTPRIIAGAALALFGWYKQNRFHVHLAGLKKYTLPCEGWFQHIVCPHYTAECLIYAGIAVVAAPEGTLFNKTILCGLGFVAANLGVTAWGTKQWYAQKFGAEKVAKRWIMIPFVF